MNKLTAFDHVAFRKLFTQFKKKYYSFGSMRGTVSLKEFRDEEVEEIAGFLGVSKLHLLRKGSLALKQFEEQLATSAFAHLSLVELVEAVLKEELQTKEQEQLKKQSVLKSFTAQLQTVLAGCPKWLQQIEKKEYDSRFIWQQQALILPEIQRVATAVANRLPKEQFERLPIFAQRITGNPHAFDVNTMAGKLLVHAAYSLSNEKIPYPKTTEERVELLATLRIVQDDLWNFVTCQGLQGFVAEEVHPVWQAAIDTKSALNMPMRELMLIDYVKPANGNQVWVVENSGVASTLMDANPAAPIICTHGQLRMASWRLLDLLGDNAEIYYSGDLDPEGIRIAEKITERYAGRVHLWHMNLKNYHMGKSDILSEERLAKLQHVKILPEVVHQMRHDKQASYQEAWLLLMINDILRDSR